MSAIALTFVIPLYRSAETIASVVRDIETLDIEGGHEIISSMTEAPTARARWLAGCWGIPGCRITLIEHARNFGEHNAVLTGWRHARGAHIVNLDDDGQNPPAEAMRLWEEARRSGLDVVFGHYR